MFSIDMKKEKRGVCPVSARCNDNFIEICNANTGQFFPIYECPDGCTEDDGFPECINLEAPKKKTSYFPLLIAGIVLGLFYWRKNE